MKSITTLIDTVRKRLDTEGITPESRESLLSLLSALLTVIASENPRDKGLMARLVETFADSSSLLALVQQQAAELDALKRITFNLTSSLELQVVLDSLVAEAMHLVKEAHDAHIFLYNEPKMEFGASLSMDGKKNELFAEPRTDGLTHHIAKTRQLLVVEDMQNHPLFQNIPPEWVGSIIGIPLMIDQRVIGVMNLARACTGPFSEAEIRLLTLLSDQASIAIINARLHQAVTEQARRDVLTSLPNRRALDERLDDEIKRAGRSGRPFCVIMMDLDGFKAINDTYGHNIGDSVLRKVSHSLQDNLRASDFLARYGGDELTLVLTDTDLHQAEVVIEKIKKNLASLPIHLPDETITHMTVSGGIALHPSHATTAPGLLRASDEALYRAKRHGGDQFMVAIAENA